MRVPARNRAPPNANANAKNGGQGLLCRCSEPAVERTVNKDGPNQGRKFWACPRPRDDGSCGFFEWADGVGGGAAGSGPSRARGPAVPAKRPVVSVTSNQTCAPSDQLALVESDCGSSFFTAGRFVWRLS